MAKESALEKYARAGNFRNGFFSGVDQVGIFFALVGKWPTPSIPFSDCRTTSMPSGNVIRDQRGQADAEIHVVAVAQFLRHAARDDFAVCLPVLSAASAVDEICARRVFERCVFRFAFHNSRP